MHGMPKQQTVHMCESVISYIAEFACHAKPTIPNMAAGEPCCEHVLQDSRLEPDENPIAAEVVFLQCRRRRALHQTASRA